MQITEEPFKNPPNRMQAYRARLRAQGLRPVQIWVPDIRDPKFIAELQRQSIIAAQHESEKEAMDWVENIIDWDNL